MTQRERLAELARQVREAGHKHDPLARAMIELLKLSIDEIKDSLVTASGDDMLRKQGGAQQLSRLLKDLTVTPPSMTTPGANL